MLGVGTMAQLGAKLGDEVNVAFDSADKTQTMIVVGSAVFPALGFNDGDRASLGRGALVSRTAEELDSPADWVTALVNLRSGADKEAFARRHAESASDTEVLLGARPADVASLGRLGHLPTLLLFAFALVVVAGLGHTLVTAGSTYRGETATLRALGAGPGLLRRAEASHALTTLAVALVLGVPIGIAAGRIVWVSLARDVGVITAAPIPVEAIGLLTMAATVVAVLAASIASHTRSSPSLDPRRDA